MNFQLLLLAHCQGFFMTNNVTFIAVNGLVGLSLAPASWMAPPYSNNFSVKVESNLGAMYFIKSCIIFYFDVNIILTLTNNSNYVCITKKI